MCNLNQHHGAGAGHLWSLTSAARFPASRYLLKRRWEGRPLYRHRPWMELGSSGVQRVLDQPATRSWLLQMQRNHRLNVPGTYPSREDVFERLRDQIVGYDPVKPRLRLRITQNFRFTSSTIVGEAGLPVRWVIVTKKVLRKSSRANRKEKKISPNYMKQFERKV